MSSTNVNILVENIKGFKIRDTEGKILMSNGLLSEVNYLLGAPDHQHDLSVGLELAGGTH